MSKLTVSRARIATVFAAVASLAYWRAQTQVTPAEEPDIARYRSSLGPIRDLLGASGGLFSTIEIQGMRDSLQQIATRLSARDINWSDAAAVRAVSAACDVSMARIIYILESSAHVERIWLNQTSPKRVFSRRWPAGSGLVLLRIGRTGSDTDTTPEFLSRAIDLASEGTATLRFGRAQTVYAILSFENAKSGITTVPVSLTSGGRDVGEVDVAIDVPPAGNLQVKIEDAATGKATAAVAGFYSTDHRLVVPTQALSFDEGGFAYRPGRVRPYRASHYWPGTSDERQVFFVDGGFSMAAPAGTYKLIVGKGFEYIPKVRTVQIEPGGNSTQVIRLERWVDMPAQGWYSGDTHVHYARAGEEANRRLGFWASAEDVHMINVMRMGDALKTYYEQYAYGMEGRKLAPGFAIVPGQEDPRTSSIGHTLQLNLQSPIRFLDQYYLYDRVFDETHRQGGLTGYAHTYQPPGFGFWVRENMTMNVPRHKLDFVEISQNGDIDYHLFYEFLNLGFRLSATGGSDVPYTDTIGSSRVYAYTGSRFDPDTWFNAVKAGRTFVTTGPMLELTVNGEVPGSEIPAKPGDTLRIRATASGQVARPQYLEVVEQGDILKALGQPSGREQVSCDFTFKVRHSTWIAARCAGALTSPVYVRVGEEPFWKLKDVPELIQTRLNQLDDVETLASLGVPRGGEGGWNNLEGFRKQVPALLESVAAARKIYLDMLERAKLVADRQAGQQ
jgi:hypothetical protein